MKRLASDISSLVFVLIAWCLAVVLVPIRWLVRASGKSNRE